MLRQQVYRQTGAAAFAQYPLSLYHRVGGRGRLPRPKCGVPGSDRVRGFVRSTSRTRSPSCRRRFTGDTDVLAELRTARRAALPADAQQRLQHRTAGTLSRDIIFDGRQYVPLSRRNELALRLYAAYADGDRPNIYYFGGLDTLRGFDYNTFAGNRAAYLNAEWRFPLIDHLILPWLQLSEVRGRFFLDVGGAYFDVPGFKQDFDCYEDGRLQDCVSSYGFGMSLYLFGLPCNWDFSKRWDFKHTYSKGSRTSFWVGFQF